MSEIVQDFSAPALIRAIEANHCELFKAFGHWPQAEVHDDPTMLWTLTDIPFPCLIPSSAPSSSQRIQNSQQMAA